MKGKERGNVAGRRKLKCNGEERTHTRKKGNERKVEGLTHRAGGSGREGKVEEE